MINPKDKLSIRRQCELIHLNRSDVYYKHTENEKKREYEEKRLKQSNHTRATKRRTNPDHPKVVKK